MSEIVRQAVCAWCHYSSTCAARVNAGGPVVECCGFAGRKPRMDLRLQSGILVTRLDLERAEAKEAAKSDIDDPDDQGDADDDPGSDNPESPGSEDDEPKEGESRG